MTLDELKAKLNQLNIDFSNLKRKTIIEYCDKNNQYKIGEKFTDHIGTIQIEEIRYDMQTSISTPCCVYFGQQINKNGLPAKNKPRREAWQINDINKKQAK